MTTFNALITGAHLRQSLVTVRSLGRRGLSVAALATSNDVPAFSSRWCDYGFVCPAGEATDAYVAYLEELLACTRPPVLIPTDDGTIALVRQHRRRLERYTRVALADEPAITMAVNKELTLAAARRAGVRVPPCLTVNTITEIPSALKEIGLPAVVKPSESWLRRDQRDVWKGPQLVTTAEEARRAVAEILGFGGAALCQPLLTGRREAVSFLYANGEVHARFAQWAKRTIPPLGGTSVLRQSIAIPPDIGSHAERLVRDIDLEGYSEVEFRRDSAGVPYLMHISPRLSASVEVAVRAGVDFPYLLYQWASGGRIDAITTYRVGGWMRDLHGDVMTTIAALKQRGRPGVSSPVRAVLGFGLSFFRPMDYDLVDWRDPVPSVRAMSDFTRELTRSSMNKARRTLVGLRGSFS
jgi:predicted ATP-grasp superfamily ATP-dependent carboligase